MIWLPWPRVPWAKAVGDDLMTEAAMQRETVRRQKRTWTQPIRALRKGTLHGVCDDRAPGAGDGPPDAERCESSSADHIRIEANLRPLP